MMKSQWYMVLLSMVIGVLVFLFIKVIPDISIRLLLQTSFFSLSEESGYVSGLLLGFFLNPFAGLVAGFFIGYLARKNGLYAAVVTGLILFLCPIILWLLFAYNPLFSNRLIQFFLLTSINFSGVIAMSLGGYIGEKYRKHRKSN